MIKSLVAVVFAGVALWHAGAAMSGISKTLLAPKSLGELREYLLGQKADIAKFRDRGPFAVVAKKDHVLRLSAKERIVSDLFLSGVSETAPLVVLVHGYGNSKEAHTLQATHLASWGMHALVLQLPSKGSWVTNGKTLARVVSHIYRRPAVIDSRIDVKRIILGGHSFGAAAVAIALAERAPAAGGILLDPAVVINGFPATLRKVNTPVMLIGADVQVSNARNREYFYRYIPRGIGEVSIRGASHENAQFSADYEANPEEGQIAFVSALTSAAFSISSTGRLDYAWASLGDALTNGSFFNARRK